jgi:hypothetical protein
MSPLQKRALYSLIFGVIFSIALLVVFITKDVYTFGEDLSFRVIVFSLWIAVPLMYVIAVGSIMKKPDKIDERDKVMMKKASKAQLRAVLFSLAAWVVVLTEDFWGEGGIPIVFLSLIFISTLVISTLAQSLGILISYSRGASYD